MMKLKNFNRIACLLLCSSIKYHFLLVTAKLETFTFVLARVQGLSFICYPLRAKTLRK
jgi:hypothetical protein